MSAMSVVTESSELSILKITTNNNKRYLLSFLLSLSPPSPPSVVIVYRVSSSQTSDVLIKTVNNAVLEGKLTALLKTLYVTSSSTGVEVTANTPPIVLSNVLGSSPNPTSEPTSTLLTYPTINENEEASSFLSPGIKYI